MDNNYLLISELAKLFNITTHTLRFYEDKGLIKPIARTDKGYRLYDFKSLVRLEEILLFRSLGMPIEDITTYFNNKGVECYKDHLNQLDRQIDLTINELLIQKQNLDTSRKLLLQYKSYNNEFFTNHYPNRYLLFLDDIKDMKDFQMNEKLFLNVVNKATKNSNIKLSKDLVFIITGSTTKLYLLINPIDLPAFDIDTLRPLPAGTYLCCFHECIKEKDFINLLMKANKYMKKHGLTSENYAVDIYSSSYTIFNNSTDLSFIQIPLT